MQSCPDPIPEQPMSFADEQYAARRDTRSLEIGDEIALWGGLWRVASFGKKFVRLEALPGTRIRS